MSAKPNKTLSDLEITSLLEAYSSGGLSPVSVVASVYDRIEAAADSSIWTYVVPRDHALALAEKLSARVSAGESLPLYGVPFAVKDNIDVVGIPTTGGCPAFSYIPEFSAAAVERLLASGAILIGKTNLDQFATGLVGTRSPYGAPRCVFNHEYISGGSSSGSAVAVASGLVSFALGTDTAGSGRVPAAFNDIVGLKPSRGRVSTRGVLPACRTLDCVSVFGTTCDDTERVLRIVEGFDRDDPYSRILAQASSSTGAGFRFGVPNEAQLEFFGDAEAQRLFSTSVARLESIGGERTEIDISPFREAGELLYGGPWVAERNAAVGEYIGGRPETVDPVVRTIIGGAARYSATDTFRAMYRLEELRRDVREICGRLDLIVLPTTATIYRVDEVRAEPYLLNARLGYYTNSMNLLDMCGLALPAGFRLNSTPFGITLAASSGHDEMLLELGRRYESAYRSETARPPLANARSIPVVRLAVVGAHLSGQPLNPQLTSRGGRIKSATRTASAYRLYALAGSSPSKPGLVRDDAAGASIEVEVWELGVEAFGTFVAEVPPPLAIGTVELENGESVKGFVCEPRALTGALEITSFGGWRAYLASVK